MARSRIVKEKEVVGKMMAVYCRGSGHGNGHVSERGSGRGSEHGSERGGSGHIGGKGNGRLCPECAELMDYASKRLTHCRFGEEKTFCKHCPVHCYNREMRARIRSVMRYSGPRMMLHHPWTALDHLASSALYQLRLKRNK